MHLEQVKKHEHSLEQQKMMLADVQLRLESVSLLVKALRALVAETKEPEGLPIPLLIMGNKLSFHWILKWKLRHWILKMTIWRRGMLDGLSLLLKNKRNNVPVVMKLKGTSASARKGSIR